VIGYSNDLIGESLAMAALLGKAGLYLWRRAEYTQAQQWLQRALAIRQSLVGPDHLDTAHALWSLALVTLDQGDLSTARSLHERALAIRESHLASDLQTSGGAVTTSPVFCARRAIWTAPALS